MIKIDSIYQEQETIYKNNIGRVVKKNNWLIEYDGFHFEGTIRSVINELLNYERRELKKEFKEMKGGKK